MLIRIHKDNGEEITYEPTNIELVRYLESESNVKEVFEHILTLGFYILTLPLSCRYSFDSITNGFQEMKDNFSVVNDKLEPIQTNGTAAKIGRLAELLAQRNFNKSFPSFTYDNVAGTDKSGDAIINTHLSIGFVMIEYKNYNTSVSQQEVDKLYRDMDNKNTKYAIFMSFKSPISNKQSFEYEVRGDKTVVFVSCGGYDGICLEVAMRFLIHLHEVDVVSIYDKSYELSSKIKYKEFQEFYESLFHLSSKVTQLNTTIQESRDTMNKSFDKMMRESISIESDINCLLSNVKEFSENISTSVDGESLSYDKVVGLIDDKITNKNTNLLIKRFINLTHQKDLEVKADKYVLFFTKGSFVVCKMDISKIKIEVSFSPEADRISYDPTYETYKHNRYFIQLKGKEEVWTIMSDRIQNLIVE
jgi:hypothetical protein